MWPDIFNSDAFSMLTLTAAINKTDFVPGRAGELAFNGVAEGVATTAIAMEQIGQALSLIQTSSRGAPAPEEVQDKAVVNSIGIPHIILEDTIQVSQLQNVRQFGSADTLRGQRSVVDRQIAKMNLRHDLTLENLRLGALRGQVLDKDGSVLADLFNLFGVSQPANIDFDDVFTTGTEESLATVRQKCQQVIRTMTRNLKSVQTNNMQVWAFAGDNFFDKLIDSTSVKRVWDGWLAAERRLGADYAHGIYNFADIMFENYRGTDDQTSSNAGTVGVDPDSCQFFLTGVPGLYAEYLAPGDFLETANTLGLPRYAKLALDNKFNRAVYLHTQANPLPICTRPATLIKGTSSHTTEA